MNTFEKNTLLDIYRTYSLDESIAYLKTIISPLQIEIGILNSEIEELKEKNKKVNIQNNDLQRSNKELKDEIRDYSKPIIHYLYKNKI